MSKYIQIVLLSGIKSWFSHVSTMGMVRTVKISPKPLPTRYQQQTCYTAYLDHNLHFQKGSPSRGHPWRSRSRSKTSKMTLLYFRRRCIAVSKYAVTNYAICFIYVLYTTEMAKYLQITLQTCINPQFSHFSTMSWINSLKLNGPGPDQRKWHWVKMGYCTPYKQGTTPEIGMSSRISATVGSSSSPLARRIWETTNRIIRQIEFVMARFVPTSLVSDETLCCPRTTIPHIDGKCIHFLEQPNVLKEIGVCCTISIPWVGIEGTT